MNYKIITILIVEFICWNELNPRIAQLIKFYILKIVWPSHWLPLYLHPTSRSRAAVARRAHNPKVGSSILPFATKGPLWGFFIKGYTQL